MMEALFLSLFREWETEAQYCNLLKIAEVTIVEMQL